VPTTTIKALSCARTGTASRRTSPSTPGTDPRSKKRADICASVRSRAESTAARPNPGVESKTAPRASRICAKPSLLRLSGEPADERSPESAWRTSAITSPARERNPSSTVRFVTATNRRSKNTPLASRTSASTPPNVRLTRKRIGIRLINEVNVTTFSAILAQSPSRVAGARSRLTSCDLQEPQSARSSLLAFGFPQPDALIAPSMLKLADLCSPLPR